MGSMGPHKMGDLYGIIYREGAATQLVWYGTSMWHMAQACMAHHALAEIVGQHPSHLPDDCGLTNTRPPQEQH